MTRWTKTNSATKENDPGILKMSSGLLSEFKLPTDSPFGYSFPQTHHLVTYIMLHHVTSIVSITINRCILFVFMYLMCMCILCIPKPNLVAGKALRHSEKSGLGGLTSKGSGPQPAWRDADADDFGQSFGGFPSMGISKNIQKWRVYTGKSHWNAWWTGVSPF